MANKVTALEGGASAIYEGGDLTQITAEELKGNIIAIRQLINSHNLATKETKDKERQIQDLKAENEYLKTGPYVAIIAATINIIGSLIIGLSTEMIGNEQQIPNGDGSKNSMIFLVSGIVLVLLGSLAPILYPKARVWFNKSKEAVVAATTTNVL